MEINTIKEFNYKGFDCIVKRVGFTHKDLGVLEAVRITGSDDFSMRTWWLCGYVILPGDHPLNGKNNTWVIVFDCNHLSDGNEQNTEEYVVSEIQKVVDQITDPDNDLRRLLDDMAYGEG